MKRYKVFLIVFAILLVALIIVLLWRKPATAPAPQVIPAPPQSQIETPQSEKTFDKNQHSLAEPMSLWVIINKDRPLQQSFKPTDLTTPKVTLNSQKTAEENQLRTEAAKAAEELFADAETRGFKLMLASGFRSYNLQNTYYNGYVARDGQAAADRYSARPGTSEHQTGLSIDISRADRKCYLDECFADQPEGKWLAENVNKYGFVLRYPSGKENVTGYQYEPWHFRYVGKELAAELAKTGQTLEEFFEL